MAHKDRQYEAIVFGATGYTGEYTATHIAQHLPTDFKWALAGRSESKLRQIAQQLKKDYPDRVQPGIEVAQLEKHDLERLCKKTQVLINTVGPYFKYSSPVVKAASETGTHYLDVTGEVPWTYEMLKENHDVAKKNKAIIINQIGVESAPADLIAWRLVTYVREKLNAPTAELIESTHVLNSAPSGGTLATVLGIFDKYSLFQLAKASSRWSLSAIEPPTQHYKTSIWEKLTGMRSVKALPGPLTDSISGSADLPIVHRSWSLYDAGKYYGPNFHLSTYMRASNALAAVVVHYALTIGIIWLVFPPIRWLLRLVVYKPGQGPDREQAKKDRIEWRAVATADTPDKSSNPKQAYLTMKFDGSMYHLTGIFLAEAAVTLTRSRTLAHEIGGGFCTPATLGMPFFERLQKVGLESQVKLL